MKNMLKKLLVLLLALAALFALSACVYKKADHVNTDLNGDTGAAATNGAVKNGRG